MHYEHDNIPLSSFSNKAQVIGCVPVAWRLEFLRSGNVLFSAPRMFCTRSRTSSVINRRRSSVDCWPHSATSTVVRRPRSPWLRPIIAQQWKVAETWSDCRPSRWTCASSTSPDEASEPPGNITQTTTRVGVIGGYGRNLHIRPRPQPPQVASPITPTHKAIVDSRLRPLSSRTPP